MQVLLQVIRGGYVPSCFGCKSSKFGRKGAKSELITIFFKQLPSNPIKTLGIFNRQFTGETNDTHHFNQYKLSFTGQKKFISNEAHKV